MTDRQKFKFYFPAWRECCLANHWHVARGRVVIDPDRLTDEGRRLVELAEQRAAAGHRGLALDDLRHGAHLLALGRDKSSAALTNADLDRVVTLFRLLTDPDDLAARLKWDAYARGENPGIEARLDWCIAHAAPEAYARAVAAGKFGTRQWERLNLDQKRQLATTLSNRRRAQARRLPAPQLDPANTPF